MTVRVLIADDHPVVRAGVTALLGTDPDIDIVATASTPAQALAAAATTDLDLMLLDLQFSSDAKAPSGVEVTRKVRSQPNPPEVLILTNYDTDADILAAVEAVTSSRTLPPRNCCRRSIVPLAVRELWRRPSPLVSWLGCAPHRPP